MLNGNREQHKSEQIYLHYDDPLENFEVESTAYFDYYNR